jgi:hypothetical protein
MDDGLVYTPYVLNKNRLKQAPQLCSTRRRRIFISRIDNIKISQDNRNVVAQGIEEAGSASINDKSRH